jgi:hypothetical protein
MAAGSIISVLSKIPWGQVVENAPKVTEAAAKLWNTVTNRRKQDSRQNEQSTTSSDAPLSELDLLKAKILALEDGVKCLQDQMQESSELIKSLAEQNTLLVQRIELNRVRLVRLAIATTLGGTILLAIAIYLFPR